MGFDEKYFLGLKAKKIVSRLVKFFEIFVYRSLLSIFLCSINGAM